MEKLFLKSPYKGMSVILGIHIYIFYATAGKWTQDFLMPIIASEIQPCNPMFVTYLQKMVGPLRLLNIACAAKARSRSITLARSTRDEILHFSILGGYERGFGLFISKVDRGSRAENVGLKRGDQVCMDRRILWWLSCVVVNTCLQAISRNLLQILEVNGQSFEHMSHARALDMLRGSTHLSITVKSNFLGKVKVQTIFLFPIFWLNCLVTKLEKGD